MANIYLGMDVHQDSITVAVRGHRQTGNDW